MVGNGIRFLTVAIVALSGFAVAQDPGVSREEFEALKARMAALEEENSTLKADLGARDAAELEDRLESQINAMLAAYQQGPIQTAKSKGASIGGEIRTRGNWALAEDANGLERDGGYVAALARLEFAFDVTKGVKAFIAADALYTFGEGADTNNLTSGTGSTQNGTSLQLHEAWVATTDTLGVEGLGSKTGRQEVHLGNGLMIGSGDWYEGFTHDATVWSYGSEQGKWSLAGIIAAGNSLDRERHQANSAFFTDHDMDQLYALYFNYSGFEQVKFDLYVIHVNADQDTGNYTLSYLGNYLNGTPALGDAASHTTFGLRLFGAFDVSEGNTIRYNFEFAYQVGEEVSPTVDIEGFVLEADLRYGFNVGDSKFDLFTRFYYANGPDDGETGFVPLFTDRHSNYSADRLYGARYGFADLIPLNNVWSIQLGLIYEYSNELSFGTTGLYAESDETLTAGDEAYGWEWDLYGTYKANENLDYTAGIAVIFPDDQGAFVWGLSDETQGFLFVQARLIF